MAPVLRFLVDTGAAYYALSRRLLDKIVAKPATSKLTIASLGREVTTVSNLRVERFVVGNMLQREVLVSLVDFPEGIQIDGLLGMNFMGNYRITIETDTATLVLREISKKKE